MCHMSENNTTENNTIENNTTGNNSAENAVVNDIRYKHTKVTSSFMFMLLLIVADQISKHYIASKLEYGGRVNFIDGFFSIHYVRNTGSAFSFLADKDWGIYVLTGVSAVFGIALVGLVVFAMLHEHNKIGLCLAMIASGAIGNLCDRFAFQYVIDFIRFDFGSYTFPIFNFADCYAVIGTILLIVYIIFSSKDFDSFWNDLFHRKAKDKA